jgi:hypothetical protein
MRIRVSDDHGRYVLPRRQCAGIEKALGPAPDIGLCAENEYNRAPAVQLRFTENCLIGGRADARRKPLAPVNREACLVYIRTIVC